MQPSLQLSLSCCRGCGCTWQQLNASSHLGCADCYRHFRPEIEKTVVRLHGHFQHNGRRPKRNPAADPAQLRQLLAQAVAEERYEEAAQLRDQLRKLSS
jgi:protein arginine kinase activator